MVEHWRVYRKHAVWLSSSGEEKYNDYLPPSYKFFISHSKDAAQQAFAKAVKTTHALRKAGFPKSEISIQAEVWKTTVWKNTGIRVRARNRLACQGQGA